MKLEDFRCSLRGDSPSFPATKVAKALVYLDMEPSLLQIMQVFILLQGQVMGYSVKKRLGNVKEKLEAKLSPVIKEFDLAVHESIVYAGKKRIVFHCKNE